MKQKINLCLEVLTGENVTFDEIKAGLTAGLYQAFQDDIKITDISFNTTLQERLDKLFAGNELCLAIEDRDTNLRIWIGSDEAGKHNPKDADTVFMRLDKADNYSATLSEESHAYLNNQDTPVKDLIKFGFKSSINNLHEILNTTIQMPERDLAAW
jgi:hypothetical protein